MSTSRTIDMVIVAIVAFTATSCGAAFYYDARQTRTYEFERKIPIVVRSEPAGATIMTSEGVVLGQAPLIVEEKVRVRRNRHSRRVWMPAIGCMADIVAAAAISYAVDYFDTILARSVAGLIREGLILDSLCIYYISSAAHTDEQVIPRTIEFWARRDGLADARVHLALPTMRAITLRLRRAYTFDEALVLWGRETEPPPAAGPVDDIRPAHKKLRHPERRE